MGLPADMRKVYTPGWIVFLRPSRGAGRADCGERAVGEGANNWAGFTGRVGDRWVEARCGGAEGFDRWEVTDGA